MEILAFVDVHGSLSALRELKKKAAQADLLVCAGDISIFEHGLVRLLYELNKINKPVLMIHGNHETEEILRKSSFLFKNIHYIHKKRFDFKDIVFLGYGGGGFSLRDPGFEEFAKKYEKELKKGQKVVLVTHAPPHGTTVDMVSREHHGNKSIADFIKKIDLNLVICGHLHENAGKTDLIGKTRIINPGPKGAVVRV